MPAPQIAARAQTLGPTGESKPQAPGSTANERIKSSLRGKSFDEQETQLKPSAELPGPVQLKAAPASDRPPVQREAAPSAPDTAAAPAPAAPDASDVYGDDLLADYDGPSGEQLIADANPTPSGAPVKTSNVQPAADALAAQIEAERSDAAKGLLAADDESTALDAQIEEAEDKLAAAQKASGAPAYSLAEAAVLEDLRKQKRDVGGKQSELKTKMKEADEDLAVIRDAGSDPAKLKVVLAKRGSTATADAETETFTWDDAAREQMGQGSSPISTSSDETKTTSAMVGGAAVVTEKTKNSSLGPTGASWGSGESTTITAGDASSSTATSKQKSVGLDGYTSTNTDAKSDEKNGLKSTTSSSTSTNIGLGGASRTTSNSEQVGDHVIKTEDKQGITRGDGKVGYGVEKKKTNGQVDDDGKLLKGDQTTSSANADVTLTKDTAALGGKAATERTTAHGNGVTTSTTAHCGGHVGVSIKPDPEQEGMYDMIVSMHLEAGIGAKAGAEKGKGKAKGSVNGNVSGSLDKVWTHVMTAEQSAAYRATLDSMSPGGGGGFPELNVIGQAWARGWQADSVNALIEEIEEDPEALKNRQKGDSSETTMEGTIGGGAEVGAKSGVVGVKVNGGLEASTKIHNKFKDTGDGTDMSADVTNTTGGSAGGELSVAGVGLGATFGTKDISGRGVKLSVPKGDPQYADIVKAIKGAKTEDDIAELMKQYPQLKASETTIKGKETSSKVSVGVGPAALEMGDVHGHTHEQTVDKDGKVVDRYTGHEQSSSKIKVGDYALGESHDDVIDITIDEEGNVDGDLSRTTTTSDLGATVEAAMAPKDGSAISAVTGADKPEVEEEVNVKGMFFNTQDFNNIVGEAYDPKAWAKHGVKDQEAWEELGKQIRAVGGDKRKVAGLLSEFLDSSNENHREMIEYTIRPAGSGQGGDAYEFPGSLMDEKKTYHDLVDRDSVAPITELQQKDPSAAAKQARALDDQLGKLEAAINLAHYKGEFEDEGRYGEMIARISNRRKAAQKLLGMKQLDQDMKRFEGLLTTVGAMKEAERNAYAKMMSNFDGERESDVYANTPLLQQLDALYLRYDPQWAELQRIATTHDLLRSLWVDLRPEHERLARYRKGKPPTEKTVDESNQETAKQAEANKQSDNAWNASPFHAQAVNQQREQQMGNERTQAAAAQRPRVAAAKGAAQNAAGWINYANSQGQTVSEAARNLASQGFGLLSDANNDGNFEYVCKSDQANAQAVVRQADKLIGLYQQAQAKFDEGKTRKNG